MQNKKMPLSKGPSVKCPYGMAADKVHFPTAILCQMQLTQGGAVIAGLLSESIPD